MEHYIGLRDDATPTTTLAVVIDIKALRPGHRHGKLNAGIRRHLGGYARYQELLIGLSDMNRQGLPNRVGFSEIPRCRLWSQDDRVGLAQRVSGASVKGKVEDLKECRIDKMNAFIEGGRILLHTPREGA